MGYFAKLDENDIVVSVNIFDKEDIESGRLGDPTFWVETDINTRGGVHYDENNNPDGGIALRGNTATIGQKYDRINDVFYPHKPFPSWTISGPDWVWKPPVPKPPRSDVYVNVWNEDTQSWDKVSRNP